MKGLHFTSEKEKLIKDLYQVLTENKLIETVSVDRMSKLQKMPPDVIELFRKTRNSLNRAK